MKHRFPMRRFGKILLGRRASGGCPDFCFGNLWIASLMAARHGMGENWARGDGLFVRQRCLEDLLMSQSFVAGNTDRAENGPQC
jgi:hypothetical protein